MLWILLTFLFNWLGVEHFFLIATYTTTGLFALLVVYLTVLVLIKFFTWLHQKSKPLCYITGTLASLAFLMVLSIVIPMGYGAYVAVGMYHEEQRVLAETAKHGKTAKAVKTVKPAAVAIAPAAPVYVAPAAPVVATKVVKTLAPVAKKSRQSSEYDDAIAYGLQREREAQAFLDSIEPKTTVRLR